MWGAQNNPESCSRGRGRRQLPRPEVLYEAAAARCRPGKATAIKADRTYIAAEKWELPVTGLMMFEQPLALHSTDPPCRHWPPSPNPQRDLRGKGGGTATSNASYFLRWQIPGAGRGETGRKRVKPLPWGAEGLVLWGQGEAEAPPALRGLCELQWDLRSLLAPRCSPSMLWHRYGPGRVGLACPDPRG